MKKVIKSQTGSTMILMTVFVLASILIISLSLSAIVVNGLRLGSDQLQSTKAFFAAEAGAERILWDFRKNKNDPVAFEYDTQISGCNNGENICFSQLENGDIDDCSGSCTEKRQKLSNETYYSIIYNYTLLTTTILSNGMYNGVNRVIELKY